jgi:aspartyl-tRNA(Asn)/glutamyl-tRNA(Gln) amidotransferase subunit A
MTDQSPKETALEIAQAVRAKERSAREVAEQYLQNIDGRESDIHAFNYVMRDEALAAADALDARIAKGEDVGPLAGVPVALKDNMCTDGVATTCSSKILEGWKPPYDATVVQKLREAGTVLIGKTNLDEFAMGASTENSAYGPTKNPLDLTRVPGGSSGGSAAATAAGFVPIALGSDTGGSIRQPASLCGVTGFKPTYGRVSRYGLIAFASSLDQIGPFANNVADTAAVLQAISGYDPMDSTSIKADVPDYSAVLHQGVDGLRIGIVSEMMGEGISPLTQQRVREAAEVFGKNGAKVEEVSVPSTQYGISAYYVIAPAEASSNLARYDGVRYGLRKEGEDIVQMYSRTRAEGFGAEVKRRIMLGTYALSSGYYDAYYGKAQRVRTLMIRDFAAAYENFDLLIAPTSPTTAFKIGEKSDDPLTMYLNDVCTIPANLAGLPAMSVPFGLGEENLPVGVQILGKALDEATILRAAAVLENEAK